jgi:penicillin-binding protein 1C
VRTTLDGVLQTRLEAAVAQHLATLADAHVTNAGLVVLDTETGAVRALIGSADYFDDEREGRVDIALARRSPGSTLKPFLYGLAIERGDAPSSVAFDVVHGNLPHAHNADGRERGPVRYRDALGSSLNLAALDVLERRVGLPVLEDRLGAAGLLAPGEPHGPGLVLGAGTVRPLELAAAFAALARGGAYHPYHDIEGTEQPERRILEPQAAWLVADMLSDPAARRPVFGEDLPLDLPFRVIAKTGTSAGYADNLTVATTREYTVLAWAGNFDGTPMHGVLAMRGAAPLARAALLALTERGPLTLPARPADIEDAVVCPLSGLLPGPHCPLRVRDHFARGSVPTRTCDWHAGGRIAWPSPLAEWAERRHGLAANP